MFWGNTQPETTLSVQKLIRKDIFDSMEYKKGTVLTNWHLCVHRGFVPYYEDQEPLKINNVVVTSSGNPVYETVLLMYGDNSHYLVEIDKIQLEEVRKPIM